MKEQKSALLQLIVDDLQLDCCFVVKEKEAEKKSNDLVGVDILYIF